MTMLDDIRALPQEVLAARDTQAIAAALSVGRTRLASTLIGFGRVLDALGPVDGATVLDTLEAIKASNPPLKWAWYLLERGELDVALASVRGQIDMLALGGALTTAQAAALKALAETPDPIDEMTVRQACWSDEGAWLP